MNKFSKGVLRTKFLKILQTFSYEELKSFSKFIKSPYFNTNKTIINLFSYLKTHYKDFAEINESKLHSYLFPGKTYNKKRIRDLCSEMLKLTELFLAQESFGKNDFEVKLNILKGLNPRNLQKIFISNYDLTMNKAVTNNYDYDYFHNLLALQKELFKFYNTYSFENASKQVHYAIDNVYKTISYEVLRCGLGLEAVSLEFNTKYNNDFLIYIINFLEKHSFFKEPIIEIYSHLYLLVNKPNNKSYNKVINLYNRYKTFYGIEIRKEIYMTIINYFTLIKPTSRKENHLEEMEGIYSNIYLENLHLDNNGYVILNFFINYLDILINLDKTDEASDFLEYNKDKLGFEKINIDTINYFHGRINLKINKYDLALKYLDEVADNDLLLTLEKKVLQLKCLYEVKEYDKISLLSISYKKYISRNLKNNEDTVINYKKFLENFNKMIQLNSMEKKLIDLKNNFIGQKNLFGRNWLIEKIDEKLKTLNE